MPDLVIYPSNFVIALPSSRNSTCKKGLLLICLLVALGGCDRPSQSQAEVRRFEARGIIRGVAPNRRVIDVQHEDIEEFMPSMTMPFSVRDPKQIAAMGINDAISFELTVTSNDSWIDKIKKIDPTELKLPPANETPAAKSVADVHPRLREGDRLPPFQLTDHDGRKIDFETFRGRPLVLTFIFTRCPLPNFCPLMSSNFSQLQQAIKNGSGPLAQTRLLSISFDPEFDTPQVLKDYASHEHADSNIWLFATGEKSAIEMLTHAFSVFVQREGGTISHGLATALVGGDGKIEKIWRGNGWNVPEVISEIERTK